MAKFGKMEKQYDLDEPKHECKLCSKSFSSGRSLGGHMRSHLTSSSADSEDRRDREVKRPLKASSSPTTACGYGLRENPKKTRRGLEFGRDRSLEEEEEFDCQDSQFWSGDSSSQSSDTETGFPNQKKSQRKSDVERDLEEVAICLMMLTRDFPSVSDVVIDSSSMADSSNNKILLGDGDSHSPPKRENARAGPYVSGNFDGQSRMNRDGLGRVEIREMSLGKSLQVKASDVSSSSSRRELSDDSDDLQVGRGSLKKLLAVPGVDRDLDKGSGSRFECQTCNKIFLSYQALGGHRASHGKSKACFGSKVNSIEPQPAGTEAETINQLKKRRKKEIEGAEHECSICRKVFPSGQALGGHKRSHIPETKTAPTRLPSIPKPAPVHQVRDFLDLNLPAPLEEEDDCSSTVKFKPWWVGRSHRQEPVIGLIAS